LELLSPHECGIRKVSIFLDIFAKEKKALYSLLHKALGVLFEKNKGGCSPKVRFENQSLYQFKGK
jgi:hypothetical protein